MLLDGHSRGFTVHNYIYNAICCTVRYSRMIYTTYEEQLWTSLRYIRIIGYTYTTFTASVQSCGVLTGVYAH